MKVKPPYNPDCALCVSTEDSASRGCWMHESLGTTPLVNPKITPVEALKRLLRECRHQLDGADIFEAQVRVSHLDRLLTEVLGPRAPNDQTDWIEGCEYWDSVKEEF